VVANRHTQGQSWRTFLRNQGMAFGHSEYYEERSRRDTDLQFESCKAQLERLTAEQIATIGAVLRRGLGRSQPALNNRRIGLRSAQCDRAVTHRAASVSGGSRRAVYDRSMVAFPVRSPPRGSLVVTSRVSRVLVRTDEVLRNHRCKSERDLSHEIEEAIVCLANAEGGPVSN
jgi:hypothetical protein